MPGCNCRERTGGHGKRSATGAIAVLLMGERGARETMVTYKEGWTRSNLQLPDTYSEYP